MSPIQNRCGSARSIFLMILASSCLAISGVWAAEADLSDSPMVTNSGNTVKPNIFFILDDSGSMNSHHIPDGLSSGDVGYRNQSCNPIYYNPNTTYKVPLDAVGTPLNNASPSTFTAAYRNGFYVNTTDTPSFSSQLDDLSTAFMADGTGDSLGSHTNQAGYYWSLDSGVAATTPLTPAQGACNIDASSTPSTVAVCCTNRADGDYNTCANREERTTLTCSGGKTLVWVKTSLGSGTAAQKQNFANWYSYYRTRLFMMKSASGLAFQGLGDKYRVGYMTIFPGTFDLDTGNPSGSVDSTKFLKISDYNTTHKTAWYSKLYRQTAPGWTPLRTALSVAGRYYAGYNDGINNGMIPNAADDPVQYACQANYTILTTDGYWNKSGTRGLTGTSTLTNQDGNIAELDAYNKTGSKVTVSPRPMYDGGTANYDYYTLDKNYSAESSCVDHTQIQQRSAQYQQCTSTASLLKRTSSDYGGSWTGWFFASSCAAVSSGKNRVQCDTNASGSNRGNQYRISENGGVDWGPWEYTSDNACVVDNSGSYRVQCRLAYKCQSNATWANAQCTNTTPTSLPLCQLSSATPAWADVGSCTAVAQNGSGVATECQTLNIGYRYKYSEVATKTTYDTAGGVGNIQGSPVVGSPTTGYVDATCYPDTAALPASGPYTGLASGVITQPAVTCDSGTQEWPCEKAITVGGTSDTLADAAQYYYKTDLRYCSWDKMTDAARTATGKTRDKFCTDENSRCKSPLNANLSICHDIVPPKGSGTEDDRANWQHMTTYTMGLGLSGNLSFKTDYKTATSGDFHSLRGNAPVINWPSPHSSDPGKLDDLWHAAVNGRGRFFSADNPDAVLAGLNSALAAMSRNTGSSSAASTSNQEPVEGDNFVYSASFTTQAWTGELVAYEIDPASGVVRSDANWSAQTNLDKKRGAACDNRTIKVFNASATDKLVDFTWNTYACNAAYAQTGTASTGLTGAETGFFDSSEVAQFSHYADMSDSGGTVDQRTLAAGANLVNYLRGQSGKEGFVSTPIPTSNDASKLYRSREHVLGDIVSAQPLFIKGPVNNFTDVGYVTFKTNNANRTPIVYSASNDGMLHAFYAGTPILATGVENVYDETGAQVFNVDSSAKVHLAGDVQRTSGTGRIKLSTNAGDEAWAFIPTMALPNLWALASEAYGESGNHRFMLDGSPTAADVFDVNVSDCNSGSPTTPENCWKTVLVAGMNKGGAGYYALDVTNPTSPKALWEFKQGSCYDETDASTMAATNEADCNIGYTYGKPVIGKLANGKWVAMVTSGLNNTAGDGKGYLYILDAITGKIVRRIGTGVGDTTTPSGLNQITAWSDNSDQDNTISRVYGGDLLGNLWRFDVNNSIDTINNIWVTKLAQLVDTLGNPQPITTRPRLGLAGAEPFVYVGTGKFLGDADKTDLKTQTVWAIKDTLTETTLTNLRSSLGKRVLKQQGTGTNIYRILDTAASGSCTPGNGWYADLPDSGERITIDMLLVRGTLVAGSNVPTTDACDKGGYAWINFFDAATGCDVPTSADKAISKRLYSSTGGSSMLSGIYAVGLEGNKTGGGGSFTGGGKPEGFDIPVGSGGAAGERVSWREIIQ